MLYVRPVDIPFTAYGSLEMIAAENVGLVETRTQIGAIRSIGRVTVESYWLQRRLHGSALVNGFGLTASWRVGD